MTDESTLAELRSWERKAVAGLLGLLTTAFLAWAAVVWNSADKVMVRIDRMNDQLQADRLEQQMYRAAMERRLSLVEDRQAWVLKQLDGERRP